MKDTTKVIFRKWRDGQIIALFPQVAADTSGIYCSSYEHVGQHGAADYTGVVGHTAPATAEEYAELKKELEQRGYTLAVATRSSPADDHIRYREFNKPRTKQTS